MSLRAGSAEARNLFAKKITNAVAEEWMQYDDSAYYDAIRRTARDKKRPDLIDLDRFLYQELKDRVMSRTPPHITHEEISDIMKWKLARGQMRPLQKLVESNSTGAVESATTRCLESILASSSSSSSSTPSSSSTSINWENGLTALCELKGIGVATATAILSVFVPEHCPFMADEVIDAAVIDEKRDYTLKIYKKLQRLLVQKAEELNSSCSSGSWTAEKVGKALWTCAKRASSPSIETTTDSSNHRHKSSKPVHLLELNENQETMSNDKKKRKTDSK